MALALRITTSGSFERSSAAWVGGAASDATDSDAQVASTSPRA
jgi:hypothetical protein